MGTAQHRLGIIGCGQMEDSHREFFHQAGKRIDIVGTSDIDIERARHAANVLGADMAVSDYRDLLEHVDAVLIVTPHDLHHEMGITALRAGVHVLMEKPLAVSESECLDLIHTARDSNRVLMTAYPMRYHPIVQQLHQLLSDNHLGPVFHLSIFTEQHTEPPPGHWIRSAKRLGGGQFFSHGCHYVDLLLWMLGRPLTGIHVGTRRGTEWMELEGTSDSVITFESGSVGYHFGTWGARGSRLQYSLHAHCERGMLEADLTRGQLVAHHGWDGPPRPGGLAGTVLPPADAGELLAYVDPNSKHLGGELLHFLDCLDTGETPLTDGPGSLQGLRAIWRMYEAERRGLVADLRGLGLDDQWDRPGLDRLPRATGD